MERSIKKCVTSFFQFASSEFIRKTSTKKGVSSKDETATAKRKTSKKIDLPSIYPERRFSSGMHIYIQVSILQYFSGCFFLCKKYISQAWNNSNGFWKWNNKKVILHLLFVFICSSSHYTPIYIIISYTQLFSSHIFRATILQSRKPFGWGWIIVA